jgi:hypothetical protein
MKYLPIFMLLAVLVLSACTPAPENPTLPETPDEEFTTVQFRITGETECTGVGSMTCYVTDSGLFYDEIEGFTYEQGYEYQVTVEKVPRASVPQDANAYKFILIELLSKEEKPFSCTIEEQQASVCTQQYAPVCGENGETYSNDCFACASGEVVDYAPGACEVDAQTICQDANGTWIEQHEECEYVSENFCDLYNGSYAACESACRHDERSEVCTKQCVPVCSFA